ncbi:MAG: hypothetical protein GX300_01175 [Tissierellia bacterium]|nr:hypothetical protein [Tissierellia bacterium]
MNFRFVHIIFIAVGLLYLLFPKTAWRLKLLREDRNSEPPKYAININRVLGGILILIGLYKIFFS